MQKKLILFIVILLISAKNLESFPVRNQTAHDVIVHVNYYLCSDDHKRISPGTEAEISRGLCVIKGISADAVSGNEVIGKTNTFEGEGSGKFIIEQKDGFRIAKW